MPWPCAVHSTAPRCCSLPRSSQRPRWPRTRPADASAAADAGDAADGAGINDIVVTATRKESRLQSTPVAVSVIGQEIRSTQNVITTRDLAGQIPGLYTAPSGITPTTNTFFIRGIGNSDPIFDPTVGTYIDDVYLARAINGMSDLHDVERVEVLRGPQGTLFGANSGGGAIRYVTKTPTDQFEAFGDVGYGNYNTFNAHGYVAGPLVDGLLAASISAAHAEHDGYTWNPSQQANVNNQNITSGRIKLVFTPAAGLRFTLTGDGTIDHSQAAQYVAKAFTTINATQKQPNGLAAITAGTLFAPTAFSPFQDNVSYAGRPGVNDSLTGGLTARIDYDIDSHLSVHSISGLRAFEQAPVNYNNDGQNRVPWNAAQPRPVEISDNYINYYQHQFTQELQLQGNWQAFDFTGGLYYLFENFSSDRIGYVTNGLPANNTALPAAPFDQIGNTRTFNYAAYLQGNLHITDRLTLTAGGRYTIVRRAFAFRGVNDDLDGNPIDPVLYPQVLTGGAIPALGVSIPATQINFTNANALNRKTWRSFTPKGRSFLSGDSDDLRLRQLCPGFRCRRLQQPRPSIFRAPCLMNPRRSAAMKPVSRPTGSITACGSTPPASTMTIPISRPRCRCSTPISAPAPSSTPAATPSRRIPRASSSKFRASPHRG